MAVIPTLAIALAAYIGGWAVGYAYAVAYAAWKMCEKAAGKDAA